nr:hypothetical protein [uncultured Draconibacterium sp.]
MTVATNVGGIVGMVHGTGDGILSINSSFNTGALGSMGSTSLWGGGIIGASGIGSNKYSNSHLEITNCYNTGEIRAFEENSFLGGIAGRVVGLSSTITNSYNVGEIVSSNKTYIGGIIAYLNNNYSDISNCYYLENSVSNRINYSGIQTTNSILRRVDFLETLNDNSIAWEKDKNNNGFPILTGLSGKFKLEIKDLSPVKATISASINTNATIITKGFQYRKIIDSKFTTQSTDTFLMDLNDLEPNSQYEFRAFIGTSEHGTFFSTIESLNPLQLQQQQIRRQILLTERFLCQEK